MSLAQASQVGESAGIYGRAVEGGKCVEQACRDRVLAVLPVCSCDVMRGLGGDTVCTQGCLTGCCCAMPEHCASRRVVESLLCSTTSILSRCCAVQTKHRIGGDLFKIAEGGSAVDRERLGQLVGVLFTHLDKPVPSTNPGSPRSKGVSGATLSAHAAHSACISIIA